jgi:hypothetical protein
MADRQGIEIDYCPQCRGVWLDRGELDKIIERSQQYYSPTPTSPSPASPASTSIPETPRREMRSQGLGEGYRPIPYHDDDRDDYRDRDYRDGDRDDDYRHGRRKRRSFLDDIFDFD